MLEGRTTEQTNHKERKLKKYLYVIVNEHLHLFLLSNIWSVTFGEEKKKRVRQRYFK